MVVNRKTRGKKYNKNRKGKINKSRKYNQKCKTTTIKNQSGLKRNRTKKNISMDEHLEKKFKKLRCSPQLKDEQESDYTCYNKRSLDKMKNLWNARHPDSKIKTNDSKQIWIQLKNRLSNVCNNERCWMEQQFMKSGIDNTIKNFTFAPFSPSKWKQNPNEWLSSVDILNVMKQYEKTYPCFEFIGPSPIDFDKRKMYGECVWDELCHFNLENQIKKKKTKIGVSFNLDPHYKPGSHWVSLFINIKKKTIFYFDSNGDKIPRQINGFVKRVIQQGNKLGMNFKFDSNHPKEHQEENTECGIYSLYFLINQLKDKFNPAILKKKRINDKTMQKFRKIYFNEAI